MAALSTESKLDWFGVLADATRARILRLLDSQELTVAELCSVVQLPQSTVSRHLKTLVEHQWVDWRAEGTSRLYRMSPEQTGQVGRELWRILKDVTDDLPKVAEDDRRLIRVLADRGSRSQEFFSSSAGEWDKLRTELYGQSFDLLALPALLDPNLTVGDFGCGTAQLSEVLAPYVKQVIAIDDSAIMLRHARRRLKNINNIILRRGNLDQLPIENDELDAAICCMVLHHLPDPQEVLAESARVIKSGGRILLIDMLRHDRTKYQQQMGHIWLGFEPEQITQWLTAAGFGQVRIHSPSPDPAAKGPPIFTATATRTN